MLISTKHRIPNSNFFISFRRVLDSEFLIFLAFTFPPLSLIPITVDLQRPSSDVQFFAFVSLFITDMNFS